MGLGIFWTAVKLILLPISITLYLLYQLLFYISGGPFQTVRTYISQRMSHYWENYLIHLVCYCFPSWSQAVLFFFTYIFPFLFITASCIMKPPYRSYFVMPPKKKRLLLYPRQLLLFSSLQLNSIFKWQFSFSWMQYLGFSPIQRAATNGHYILTLLFNKLHDYLTTKSRINDVLVPSSKLKDRQPTPKCLTTEEACHSTDNIFFDSDGDLLYLDTCATDSMSPFLEDFIPGTYVPIVDIPDVKGSGGPLPVKGYGTARYSAISDDGHTYVLEIPDTAFIPSLDYRLLAPQYLKKVERLQGVVDANGNFTTGFHVDEDFSTLRYNGGNHICTIRHILAARVPAMPINRGTKSYQAFCSEMNKIFPAPKSECYAMPTQQVDDDESASFSRVVNEDLLAKQHAQILDAVQQTPDQEEAMESTLGVDFSKFSPEQLNEIFCQKTLSSDQEELLALHEKTNHCVSMQDIQTLAIKGHLPQRLALCPHPVCSGCLFGKAHKRPWRYKSGKKKIRKNNKDTKPGDCVSVDTFCSSIDGLIPQSKGIVTNDNFSAGTVFVDYASDYVYTHFQVDQSTESAIAAKEAFERNMAQVGVTVKRYHADNGIFASRGFVSHVEQSNPHIEYCGVGAYFQNGIAENAIKIGTGNARTMLLHAMYRWPEVITANLWPFAVALADWNRNHFRIRKNGLTSMEFLTNTKDDFKDKIHHSHPFGSPRWQQDPSLGLESSYWCLCRPIASSCGECCSYIEPSNRTH